LKRTVALKFLPQHVSASETDKARFLLEAQAAAALNHPNICTIHGIEQADGQTFIVMEFVDGQTLREKRASLGLPKAVDVGVQIAEGLSAAHEKGIVHRDIKPENIMVRKDGLVQIMDFGLAKLRASRASRLTKEGSTVGTAGYMSPEQVQGQETDHRSDIFSLGVLLYELFTGELPFKGVHETALLYEIVNVDPAPMSSVRPEIDPELDRIVQECLQKEPDERYNSVKDLAKELKRFKRESSRERASRVMPVNTSAVRPGKGSAGSPTGGAPGRGGSRSGMLWPAVALAALAGAGVLLYLLLFARPAAPADVTKFVVALPPGEFLARGTTAVDLSPDGRQIAMIVRNEDRGERMIVLRRLNELVNRPVAGTDGAADVHFSPDGEWLVFTSDGKVKKVPVRGGSAITLANVQGTRGSSWGADNRIYYTPSPGAPIFSVPADGGGEPVAVTTLDSSKGEVSHRGPQLLPGGEALLYTIKTKFISTFSEAKIAVQRIDSKEKKILVDGGSFGWYVGNGQILYAKGPSLFLVPFDPAKLELTGSPEMVLDSAGMLNEPYGCYTALVSANGTFMYAPGGPLPVSANHITMYDRAGAVVPFLEVGGPTGPFSIAPDGKRVAAQYYAANDDIWILDAERQVASRFTFAGGNNWYPLWTPDGQKIVFTCERDGSPNLFLRSADGSGTEARLARSPFRQIAKSFTPDGKTLVYEQLNSDGNSDLWMLPMDGSQAPQPLANSRFDEVGGAVSPDGHWLAFVSNESGRPEVYVRPFPRGEGKSLVSTGGGTDPAWTKGGREIMFVSINRDILSVPVDLAPAFRPGASTTLFRIPAGRNDIKILPNGDRIAVSLVGSQVDINKLVVVLNWFTELKENARRDGPR
jgi:Tol biopolymer transport system component